MGDLLLLDNDIVFKVSCYRIVDQLRELLASRTNSILGLARYVVRRKIRTSKLIQARGAALAALEELLLVLKVVEPDEAEVALAASYERWAQTKGHALDSGESLLLAILIQRAATALVTGDKRAVVAIGQLVLEYSLEEKVGSRLICFEQIMLAMCLRCGAAQMAQWVCAEPEIDKAMSISFHCTSGGTTDEDARNGLNSYIEYLRERSSTVLVRDIPC